LFTKYRVHHRLEGRRQVGEAKEHYGWFKKPLVCYEGRFVLVLSLYPNRVISPADVDDSNQVTPSNAVDELGNEW
jgi:hypothetical protein